MEQLSAELAVFSRGEEVMPALPAASWNDVAFSIRSSLPQAARDELAVLLEVPDVGPGPVAVVLISEDPRQTGRRVLPIPHRRKVPPQCGAIIVRHGPSRIATRD